MDDIPPELLKNGELFDFAEAIDNYGFDFESSFLEDNFANFIQTTFITDFITFRKGYLERDFSKLDFYSHKFKGNFKLFQSFIVANKCEMMQNATRQGNIHLDQLYVDIVNAMMEFLNALIALAQKIKKPIKQSVLDQFYSYNNLCNDFENNDIKKKLNCKDLIEIGDYGFNNPCCSVPNACILF